jgi:hypothetical protein
VVRFAFGAAGRFLVSPSQALIDAQRLIEKRCHHRAHRGSAALGIYRTALGGIEVARARHGPGL